MFETELKSADRTAGDTSSKIKQAEPSPALWKILVIDPDHDHRAAVANFLSRYGFMVFEADGGAAARDILDTVVPDIVICDVILPGDDGLSIVRELSVQSDASVIIVSEAASEVDRIVGLEVGADDYIAKPVSPRELLARVRAVRRRTPRQANRTDVSESCYTFAGCRLDIERRVLRDPRGLRVSLSDGEFSLLQIFVERPQRVLTRDQLLDLARGPDTDAYDRSIDTQISRLRRKLRDLSRDDLIRTVRNEGYMFVPKVEMIGNKPT